MRVSQGGSKRVYSRSSSGHGPLPRSAPRRALRPEHVSPPWRDRRIPALPSAACMSWSGLAQPGPPTSPTDLVRRPYLSALSRTFSRPPLSKQCSRRAGSKVYFISTRPRPGARRPSAARAGPEGQCAMYAAQAGVGARRSGVGDVLEQIKIEFSAVAEESNACQRQRDEYQHKCLSPPTLPPTHRKQSHPQSRFASWLHSHTAFWARSGRRSILGVLLSA